jgi:hypothetical protein
LAFEGNDVRRIKDAEGSTICVFIATDTMKANYQQLGEVINFDSTNRMIKKPSPYREKFAVGYFMAQDTDLRFAIVGMCLFVEHEKSLIKQVFLFFFELVCQGRMPFVIFTENLEVMAVAL